HSFDIIDHAPDHVPEELTHNRWTFTKGDVRAKITHIPRNTDYLFIDAAHNGWFARWYIHHLLPTLPAHIPISVHDVFHQRHALPFTEGAVILKWLDNNTTDHFTASAARSPHTHQKLTELKKELDLAEPIHTAQHNPMIFFHMPANPRPGAPIPPQRPTPPPPHPSHQPPRRSDQPPPTPPHHPQNLNRPPRPPNPPTTPPPHPLTPTSRTARPPRLPPPPAPAQHPTPLPPPSASTDEAPEPPSTAAAASRAPTTSAASATIREKFTG